MRIILCFLCFFWSITVFAQVTENKQIRPDSTRKILVVEAACGQCQFGLHGKGCSLAVRMNGKAYFVDGTDIDSHGDAHASDGFCNAKRSAEVQGRVVNNRFKASYFKLLDLPATAPNAIKKAGSPQ